MAYAWGKIIIAVVWDDDEEIAFQRWFPLQLCTSVFPSIEAAIKCVEFMARRPTDEAVVR